MAKLQLNQHGTWAKPPNSILAFEPTHASRYYILATMLAQLGSPKDLKVLDVGGKKGLLAKFSGFKPTVIDIEESDEPRFVQGSALAMPFRDEEFDYAVSCDVLEHIPEEDRQRFLTEMLRVSKQGIIVCAPFDDSSNRKLEVEMNDYYKKISGTPHRWLKEHIDNGLPKMQQIEKIVDQLGYRHTHFRHFSAPIWRQIVQLHLLAATVGDNKLFQTTLLELYKDYYNLMCRQDFSPVGYRTFLWVSKKDAPNVVLPTNNEHNAADERFSAVIRDKIAGVIKAEIQAVRDAQRSNQKSIDTAQDLRKQLRNANRELTAIKKSKSWKLALKLSRTKNRLTSIGSSK